MAIASSHHFMHIKWHKYHRNCHCLFVQTNYILTRITCRRAFWAFEASGRKVNLIYDKCGYKMIQNDGIAMMSHAHALQFKAIKFLLDFHSFRWQFMRHCWRWNGCARSLCATQMTDLIVINFFREFYFLTHKLFVIQYDIPQCIRVTSDLAVKSYEVMHLVCRCVWLYICVTSLAAN